MMGVYVGPNGEYRIGGEDAEFFMSVLDMPPEPAERLKELLKKPAPWPETDWGSPQGKEVW